MKKFEEGMRVRLLPNEEEGWVEEFGTVHTIEDDEMMIVQVDEQYRDKGLGDTGIREMAMDNDYVEIVEDRSIVIDSDSDIYEPTIGDVVSAGTSVVFARG